MKKTLRVLVKILLFITVSIALGVAVPYQIIRDNISRVMSIETARNITDILGGYSEVYDFVSDLVSFTINILLTAFVYRLIITFIRKKQSANQIKEGR